jgi:propanol-preferring alcohol dehydrogenase
MGAGGLGLMAMALLKAMGGVSPIVVDIDPAKRQAAMEAGALAAIDGAAPDAAKQIIAANGGKLLQGVVDLVGAPSTTGIAFDCLIKGGKLVIVGLFGGGASWPIAFIPMKALQILGSYTGSLQEMRELMQLVKEGKIKPIPVHTHPLADADKVLKSLIAGKVTGRAVLTA